MNSINSQHSRLLVVTLNGAAVLEYNRDRALSNVQQESLNLMDEKLDQGITLENDFIPTPSLEQRVEFVAANLISALLNEKDVLAAASCAYIATLLPELKQIKAAEKEGEVSIELIFDREFQEETIMNFMPLDKLSKKQH